MRQARLRAYTKPVGGIANEGIDDLKQFVAYVARVSNPNNQTNTETSDRLIRFLIRNKHWSPFEMANVVMEINTTRDIARQILRHRSFSFQEFSQRYSSPKDKYVERECRLQDEKNRQNSLEVDDPNSPVVERWAQLQENVVAAADHAYRWAIDNGIAKEQARVVLPEGMTPSRMYMNGSIRSWLHYIELRTDPATQKEHRQVAEDCKRELLKVFDFEM